MIRIEVTIQRDDPSLGGGSVEVVLTDNFNREELAHATEQAGRAAFTAFTQGRPEALPF